MFLKDQPQDPPERQAAMPELLEDYKSRRVRLLAETRELDRLRQQVRASAEREAASIVTNARRNVRQVLLEARRELLVLVAQLQAVGCEAEAGGASREVVQGEATPEPDAVARADAAGREPFDARGIASGARRDVREVLLEAQAELVALAEEARELRTRIAQRQVVAAAEFPVEEPGAIEVSEAPAPEEAAQPVPASYESAPAEYTPLSSSPRVWVAIAAALVFAAVGAALFLSSGGSTLTPEPSPAAQAAAASGAEASAPSSSPAQAADAPAAAPAATPPALLVSLDVRRPAWIRTTVDGRADVGRVYNPGERRTVSGADEIVLRAGDAGAVFVSVNGAEVQALGGDGRVVTRRFARTSAPAARPAVLRTASDAAVPTAAPEMQPRDVGTTGTAEPPPPAPDGFAERDILHAAHQWFEAYFGGNEAGMKDVATPDFWLVDDRSSQRWPPTMAGVDRGLQQVRIEVAGDGAVMSARLTERTIIAGETREQVSLVSGVWIRSAGRWRLMGLRFIDPAGPGR